jgi:regulator of replication initiation timing
MELNKELRLLKNQYEELEKINKQLLIENEDLNNQLNDRSIVVDPHPAFDSDLIEKETPVELKHEVCSIIHFTHLFPYYLVCTSVIINS